MVVCFPDDRPMSVITTLSNELRPAFAKAMLCTNPGYVYRHFKFKPIRRAYYDGLWERAAISNEANYRKLSGGWSVIERGQDSIFINGEHLPLDSKVMHDLMGNKVRTYDVLSGLGAPILDYYSFDNKRLRPALAALNKHGKIVVKPSSGTGAGRAVTTGIKSHRELKRAVRFSSMFSKTLIAEPQTDLRNVRLLYLNGEFVDAVLRNPPTVLGDGKATIRDLVRQENQRRLST